ncbi:MAG: NAD(+) synthase [Bacteroidaceae bacterium]|jgi:NAD+ synthase (glutamine-hydrolysing)
MNYGFVKVAAAIPRLSLANCKENANQIESLVAIAEGKGAQAVVFPELCLTGYTCGDLFGQQMLLEEAEIALMQILNDSRQFDILTIVGMPVMQGTALFNCAVVFQHGKILGVVPKTLLPNYKEFYERRWFAPATELQENSIRLCGQTVPMGADLLFRTSDFTFGVEICEDLWGAVPPSSHLSLGGAELIFNLSASNDLIGKQTYLKSLLAQQSGRCLAGYIYASAGYGESSTDLVFGGKAFIYEYGKLLAEAKPFTRSEQLILSEIDVEKLRTERRTDTCFSANAAQHRRPWRTVPAEAGTTIHEFSLTRSFDPMPFVPKGEALAEHCREAFSIQVAGLARRLGHTHARAAVVGISGGLDSTLALLVCTHAADALGLSRKSVIGITMPGFGTTGRTYQNALDLMKSLGITVREIPIAEAVKQHFADIGHDPNVQNVTYENAQARERTQILMDVANETDGLVIGTGDLSELALGWATYNGDHISMYGVNASIPKTLVRHLVRWVADGNYGDISEETRATLYDIIDTPISPELLPADENGQIVQKTEDLVGPYELHDFFLYHMLRHGFRPAKIHYLAAQAFRNLYTEETIKHWLCIFLRRFFRQQFKRSCLPDGPKVGSISLSPRGDWRMPSDASADIWLKEAENL